MLTNKNWSSIIGGRGITYYSDVILRGLAATKSNTDKEAITNRLKRIEGQIRGLLKMVEDDKSCEEVLIQIGSAKSALHKTGQAVLESHLQHCVLDGIRDGEGEEIIKKLSSAVEQFSRLV